MNDWQEFAIRNPWLRTPAAKDLNRRHIRSLDLARSHVVVLLGVGKWSNVRGGWPCWSVSITVVPGGGGKVERIRGPMLDLCKRLARQVLADVGQPLDHWHLDPAKATFHIRRRLTVAELEFLSREWLAEPIAEAGEMPAFDEELPLVPAEAVPGAVLFAGDLKEPR